MGAGCSRLRAAVCDHAKRWDRERLADLVEEPVSCFPLRSRHCRRSGIQNDQIILDSGFGFAKDDVTIFELWTFASLHGSGAIAGRTLRKRFIGGLTDASV